MAAVSTCAVVRSALADPPLPSFGPTVYDVTVANAAINGGSPASTGSANNATALNAYITYCSGHGGGTVEIPSGTFVSGTVTMRSNVNLQLDGGSILRNSNFANTLINTSGTSSNMQISGSGTIDGNATTTVGSNKLVNLTGVTTLAVMGVSIVNAGNEHLVPENDTNVTIKNVTIADPGTLAANGGKYLANTDGIDFWGSNFLIKNCNVSDGDDNIVAKTASGPCSNITITGNTIGAGHGISVGGGTAHGLNGMTVSNCTFNGTDNGLRLKAQDVAGSDAGGGTANPVQNVAYSNITMTNVTHPIIIDSFYNGSNNFPASPTDTTHYPASPTAVGTTTPIWQNISFSNITATGSSDGGLIYGLNTTPVNLSGVSFDNVNISASKHMDLWYATNVSLAGLTVNVPSGDAYANAAPEKGVRLYSVILSQLMWNNSGGAGNGTSWDINSNANWNNGSGVLAYQDGQSVAFSDSNNGHYAVTLSSTVSPAAVIVYNNAGNYTFGGAGGIGGAATLTKGGTALLTISTINGMTGNADIKAGTLTIAGGASIASSAMTVAAGATVNVNGSLAAGAAITTGGAVNFAGNATNVTTTRTLGALSVSAGGLVKINASSFPFNPAILTPASVSFDDNTAKLNLTTNELVTSETLIALRGQIIAGNIFSSTAGGTVGSLDLGGGQVEARYTLGGDANLDGRVDVADLGSLATNYGVSGTAVWAQGDFDYSGSVDVGDLGALASNYGLALGGATSADAAALVAVNNVAVPEPAMMGMVLSAGLACRRRRRCVK
jgi:polygalacturonase